MNCGTSYQPTLRWIIVTSNSQKVISFSDSIGFVHHFCSPEAARSWIALIVWDWGTNQILWKANSLVLYTLNTHIPCHSLQWEWICQWCTCRNRNPYMICLLPRAISILANCSPKFSQQSNPLPHRTVQFYLPDGVIYYSILWYAHVLGNDKILAEHHVMVCDLCGL